MTRGIYQGWTGWRNLGDEAMFESCRRALPRIDWTARAPFDARAAGRTAPMAETWRRGAETFFGRSAALLGGGTLINRVPAWLDEYRDLKRRARRPVPVFSPGVANPEYWSRKPDWRDTLRDWREALRDLPEVGVRGPLSKRLLDDAGVPNVAVTGDPALMFGRRGNERRPSRRRVAINAGRSDGEMWGREEDVMSALGDCARRLVRERFEVRLFAVWDRDEAACRDVAAAAGLGRDAVDPLILDADRFVDYIAGFDVAISIKLHAAVLAAAARVPFVAIEYRPKVRDFTESIGCAAQTVRSCDIEGATLARAVLALHDDAGAARDRLDSRVGELTEAFVAYAGRIEQVLLS
jgi:polysaccharide pyruvyl transferase WcaK-like protein